MNVERLQDIVNKMYLSAMLISVFVCARSVFAIGESPKHYDDFYGMPAEMTEQRIYTIDGWRVNATFDGGKATAVQYMRFVSTRRCLATTAIPLIPSAP